MQGLKDELPIDRGSEARVVGRVYRRLMWFLFVISIAMSLDRTNIGFAALQMNKALGLDAAAFGFTITIYSIGYILSEVPSNVMFARFGARLWLPRIMITWGLASIAMMFAVGPRSLFSLRFILGLAEGGFLPGVILYLSFWFPEYKRARAMSLFLMAQPVTFALNPLVSGPLLDMNGVLGLGGWRWLFLLEGLPSVLLGIFAYFYLTDYPSQARWLNDTEKATLQAVIAREETARVPAGWSVLREFRSPTVLLLALSYFGLPISLASYVAWSPQIVRALLPTGSHFSYVGLVNAIPALCSVLFMPYWSARSDKRNERIWHTILPLVGAALGWLLIIYGKAPVQIVGLSLAITGTFAAQGIFFTLATALLSPLARPVGIALISATGLIGAGLSPLITGFFKDVTGSFAIGLLFVVAMLLIACVGVILVSRQPPLPAGGLDGVTGRREARAFATRGRPSE